MRSRKMVFAISVATVVVVIAGILWQNGVSNASNESPQQHNSTEIQSSQQSVKKPNSPNAETQQATSNGKKITENDWHPVGPFYYAKGTVSKIHVHPVPPEVKGPVWTDVFVTIKEYVNSKEPKTSDGSLKVGSTSSILFYDYVDKGQSHLKIGDQVIIKFAEYASPNGKIVWGSMYDDIYYKQNNDFVNNKGESVS